MIFIICIVIALLSFSVYVLWGDMRNNIYRVGCVLTLAFAVFAVWSDYNEVETRTAVVQDKDRGGSRGSYRVYTDSDTLAVKDIYFNLDHFRTNSADWYGQLKVCHEYEFSTRGWEFGLFDMMPNIVDARDLGPVEGCEQ